MAVEDHALFEEWVAALDNLKRTKEAYQSAVAFKMRPSWIEHAHQMTVVAQESFNRISDRIGSDS